MKNIIVGQSGGPTSVINSSLLGVFKFKKFLSRRQHFETVDLGSLLHEYKVKFSSFYFFFLMN